MWINNVEEVFEIVENDPATNTRRIISVLFTGQTGMAMQYTLWENGLYHLDTLSKILSCDEATFIRMESTISTENIGGQSKTLMLSEIFISSEDFP